MSGKLILTRLLDAAMLLVVLVLVLVAVIYVGSQAPHEKCVYHESGVHIPDCKE